MLCRTDREGQLLDDRLRERKGVEAEPRSDRHAHPSVKEQNHQPEGHQKAFEGAPADEHDVR